MKDSAQNPQIESENENFEQFGLDMRLLRACKKLGYKKPTLIQSKTIQLAMEGKDILGKAKTGSGKTAAYCLPVINKLLKKSQQQQSQSSGVRALILVPTRELSEQVYRNVKDLISYCDGGDVSVVNLAADNNAADAVTLQQAPAIVVGTPSKILARVSNGAMNLRESLQSLVIDEADLILSFGYEEDIQKLLTFLPAVYQSYLMSATLTADLDNLKRLILRNPVTIKLEEGKDEVSLLKQFSIQCPDDDKFLLIFFMLKLKLLDGKCIMFVNDIDRGYRLKLFLEQFGIQSCVLNSELPHNSRYHIVQEFNRGVYDYLIASDEAGLKTEKEEETAGANPEKSESNNKKKVKVQKDKEYGVARGIDFKDVQFVVNFDIPRSTQAYTHRIGRTARGGATGTALSLVGESEKKCFARIEKKQAYKKMEILPFEFDMSQVEGFRYRVEDALKAVTKNTIREARLKEIKMEILASEKLQAHFAENPKDLEALRHDKPLHVAKVKPHLKHVPDYLMPKGAKRSAVNGDESAVSTLPVTFHKQKKRRFNHQTGNQRNGNKRKQNPLKSLTFTPGGSSAGKHQKTF